MSKQQYISYRESNIFYRVEGKGQPVILLHGFGETGDVWNEWKQPLLSQYSLIIPDLPGFGSGDLPSDTLTIPSIADMIKAIIDQETSHEPVMIGHSMGGYVTLAFEEKYPATLSRLGLFHSTAEADTEEKRQNRQKAIRFIEQKGPELFVEEFIPNLFAPSFVENRQDVVHNMTERAKQLPADALIASYKAMMDRPSTKHVLDRTTKPVLFISGREDNIVPYREVLHQSLLPRVSAINLFRDIGHMGMIENPKATQAAVLQFMAL